MRVNRESQAVKPTTTTTLVEQRLANRAAVTGNRAACRPQTSGLADDVRVHSVTCVRNDNAHTPPAANQLNLDIATDHEPATISRPSTCTIRSLVQRVVRGVHSTDWWKQECSLEKVGGS